MNTRMAVGLITCALMLSLTGLACSLSLPFGAAPTPTLTETPSPTFTLTPTATRDFAATRVFQATATAGQRLSEIKAELDELNLATENGWLAFYQGDPVAIKLNQFNEGRFYPFLETVKVADFVLKTDVSWETNGLIECGLIMRSDANFKLGKQYLFVFLRMSGLPAWDLEFYNSGHYKNSILGEPKTSKAINLDNEATNQFIIIAQGNEFNIYINHVYIGRYFDYSKQATKGYMAFLASHDTGSSVCTFAHTWVWALK
jgi:hypothetical protein